LCLDGRYHEGGLGAQVNTSVKPVLCWSLFSKPNEVVTEEMKAAINAGADSIWGKK
jgi:hypothetical protein